MIRRLSAEDAVPAGGERRPCTWRAAAGSGRRYGSVALSSASQEPLPKREAL